MRTKTKKAIREVIDLTIGALIVAGLIIILFCPEIFGIHRAR